MGTILSPSTSTTHGVSRGHSSGVDYQPRVRLSIIDTGCRLADSLHITGSTAEHFATSSATNGLMINSMHRTLLHQGKPGGSIASNVPTPSGFKRMMFPGLTKMFKQSSVTPVSRNLQGTHMQRVTCSDPKRRHTYDSPSHNYRLTGKFDEIYSHQIQRQTDALMRMDSEETVTDSNQRFPEMRLDTSVSTVYRDTNTITTQNGTPYCRSRNSLTPLCRACNRLSVSFHRTSPSVIESLKVDADSRFAQRDLNYAHRYHIDDHRHLSVPNEDNKKHHLDCAFPSVTMNTHPENHKSPAHPYSNNALQKSNAATSEYSSEGVCTMSTFVPSSRRVSSKPVAPASKRNSLYIESGNNLQRHTIRSHGENILLPASSITNTSPSNIRSCPYHLDLKPFLHAELSLNASSRQSILSSPSVNVNRSHTSAHSSLIRYPMQHVPSILTEAPEMTPSAQRCNTDLYDGLLQCFRQESLPFKDNRRHKSLTKSISCYALKFFNSQQHHHRHNHHQVSERRNNLNEKSESESTSCAPWRPSVLRTDRKSINRSHSSRQTSNQVPTVGDRSKESDDICTVWLEKPKGTGHRHKTISTYVGKSKRYAAARGHTDLTYLCDRFDRTVSFQTQPYHGPFDSRLSAQNSSSVSCHSHRRSAESTCWESQCANSRLTDIRQTILTASTSELLRCLSLFVVARLQLMLLSSPNRAQLSRLKTLQPPVIVGWIKAIDRALLIQGWSDLAFINPAHVVFLFMMLKECVDCNITSQQELHTIIMACLYLSYSYMGNEISYPLKPFLVAETNQLLVQNDATHRRVVEGENALIHGYDSSVRTKVIDQVRSRFWQYCLRIINAKSTEMIRINADPLRFTELFSELKSYESLVMPLNGPVHVIATTE